MFKTIFINVYKKMKQSMEKENLDGYISSIHGLS